MITPSRLPATIAEVSRPDRHTVLVRVRGDLDFETAEVFLRAVLQYVDGHSGLRDLRLDCAELGVCDSLGLSCLLMLRRHTETAGVQLHLDNRQPSLDRMLGITSTLDYLTQPPGPAEAGQENLPAGEVGQESQSLPGGSA
jgi:anti-anti-sigma factor